jgi:thiol-disulfide isomerase/thioredoxin
VEEDLVMRVAPRAAALALLCTGACADPRASARPETTFADIEQLKSIVHRQRSRALLVVFWATWCEPCVDEFPDLVTLHDSSSESLDILGVNLDAFLHPPEKSLELVRQQLQTTPTPYPHVVYTGRQDPLFGFFEMPGGIPYAVLYDREGLAVERFAGKVSPRSVRRALGLTSPEG